MKKAIKKYLPIVWMLVLAVCLGYGLGYDQKGREMHDYNEKFRKASIYEKRKYEEFKMILPQQTRNVKQVKGGEA